MDYKKSLWLKKYKINFARILYMLDNPNNLRSYKTVNILVAPNAIHHHVKTFRENFKNMHYLAPEANRKLLFNHFLQN
jgi:hypothetical protein